MQAWRGAANRRRIFATFIYNRQSRVLRCCRFKLTAAGGFETSKPQVTNIAQQSGRKHLHVLLFAFDRLLWYLKPNTPYVEYNRCLRT